MIDRKLDQEVRLRAHDACEYCQMPQRLHRFRFPIDHIIAKQHGGETTLKNLALSCGRCNRHKGPNIAGLDPDTARLVRLYHPRCDRWTDYFRWDGPRIIGTSPEGRVTISVLAMNHPEQLAMRLEMMRGGWLPLIPGA